MNRASSPKTSSTHDPVTSIAFTVLGEPASKANSRRIVTRGGRPASIKSVKAIGYGRDFGYQCPNLGDDRLMVGDLSVTMKIYYASRRPDLDESLILDLMQGRIYANDRQVRERHTYWGLDKSNPRTEILVRTIDP